MDAWEQAFIVSSIVVSEIVYWASGAFETGGLSPSSTLVSHEHRLPTHVAACMYTGELTLMRCRVQLINSPFIAGLTYIITNFVLFQKPLVTVAKCPRCQTEQVPSSSPPVHA